MAGVRFEPTSSGSEELSYEGSVLLGERLRILSGILENGTNYKILNLRNCCVTDSVIEKLIPIIESHSSLTTLILASNQLTDKGAKTLATYLEKSSQLKMLDISYNKLKDEGARDLLRAVSKEERRFDLNLDWNETSPSFRLASLVRKNNRLMVSLNKEQEIKFIFKNLRGTALNPILSVLELSPVANLQLAYCSLGDDEAFVLAEKLKACQLQDIAKIDLRGNQITDRGAEYLINVFREGSYLREFIMDDNPIKSMTFLKINGCLRRNKILSTSTIEELLSAESKNADVKQQVKKTLVVDTQDHVKAVAVEEYVSPTHQFDDEGCVLVDVSPGLKR